MVRRLGIREGQVPPVLEKTQVSMVLCSGVCLGGWGLFSVHVRRLQGGPAHFVLFVVVRDVWLCHCEVRLNTYVIVADEIFFSLQQT